MQSKILVISAPSGGGKSVVSNHILSRFPQFEFSISSTTRATRPQEIHGKHYYFITQLAFKQKITSDEFIEYEEIFGNYYGTLKSEIERITAANKIPLLILMWKGPTL